MVVKLESEFGDVIELVTDPRAFLEKLLPPHDANNFPLLRFVDWYGNAIFNKNQMDQFLAEWQLIRGRAKNREEGALLETIERLAARVKDDSHLYLKFEGD
jgi:hypothetical protein